jgi:hypothetical protein
MKTFSDQRSAQPSLACSIIWVLGLAASLYLCFQPEIASGFRFLYGDYFDTEIETAILEHWYNVFSGLQRWTETGYFFPHSDTLGYNDGYFIYGVIYSCIRAFSVDPFVSTSLTHIVVKAVGYVGMFSLLRRFRLTFAASLLGAILFTIAGNSNNQIAHGQLLSVAFSPIVAISLMRCREAFTRAEYRKLLLHSTVLAIVFDAWMLTSFYMAWFFAFFCMALTGVGLACAHATEVRKVWNAIRAAWRPLLLCVLPMIVLIIPFLIVYLPKARETGMHPVGTAIAHSLFPLDLFNVGDRNFAWSRFFNFLHDSIAPGTDAGGEHITGFPILMIILAVAGMLYFKAKKSHGKSQEFTANKFLFCMGLAALISWFAVVKFGSFSPWRVLYFIVPGAKGIRIISRYQIFLTLPLLIIGISYLDRLRFYVPKVILFFLGAVLIGESVNSMQSLTLNTAEQNRMLAAISPVPASCDSFFVVNARGTALAGNPEVLSLYPHNVDAMLLTAYFRIPTMNGFSTFNPSDWDFSNSTSPDYVARAKAYAERHNLRGVCSLDATKPEKWNQAPFTPDMRADVGIPRVPTLTN